MVNTNHIILRIQSGELEERDYGDEIVVILSEKEVR